MFLKWAKVYPVNNGEVDYDSPEHTMGLFDPIGQGCVRSRFTGREYLLDTVTDADRERMSVGLPPDGSSEG